MLSTLAKFGKATKAKMLVLLGALAATASSAADLTQLDTLNTTIGEVTTKVNLVMIGMGALALAIVVGVIVLKVIKKGSRAG